MPHAQELIMYDRDYPLHLLSLDSERSKSERAHRRWVENQAVRASRRTLRLPILAGRAARRLRLA
ncbi:hypothetical protein ACQBAU_01780 [Propionibacteriaceae bacterium Y2011]